MRFFRAASDAAYEQARGMLDSAWGLPNALGTQTCIEPAATAPRDANGKVLLAVADEWCNWPPADILLPQMIASGAAAEIGEAEYNATVNPASP